MYSRLAARCPLLKPQTATINEYIQRQMIYPRDIISNQLKFLCYYSVLTHRHLVLFIVSGRVVRIGVCKREQVREKLVLSAAVK